MNDRELTRFVKNNQMKFKHILNLIKEENMDVCKIHIRDKRHIDDTNEATIEVLTNGKASHNINLTGYLDITLLHRDIFRLIMSYFYFYKVAVRFGEIGLIKYMRERKLMDQYYSHDFYTPSELIYNVND